MKNINDDKLDITDLMYDGYAEIVFEGEDDIKVLATRDQIDSFLEVSNDCFMEDSWSDDE